MDSSSGEPSSRIFRHPGFRSYLVAQTCSTLSFQIISLAVSWELYAMTHSAFMLGMIGLMQFVPSVLLALPAGHLADQYNRKTLIIGGQMVELLSVFGLALLPFFAPNSTTLLLAMVFLFSLARAFESPSMTSLLPALLPAGLLPKGMATTQVFRQAMVIAGPMAGGILFVVSPLAAYGTAAVAYVISLLFIRGLRYERAAVKPLPMTFTNLFAGLDFIF